jgi:hypothetical protein
VLLAVLEHDPEELRSTARDLLSRPPYRDGADGPVTDVLRRVREAVARFLQTALDAVVADAWMAWVIVAVGSALLLLVVWRATRGWNADRSVAVVPEAEPGRSSADWLADADAHAAATRWREAVRCRYAALVATLVEGGALADRPGRTVGELDREVAMVAPTIAAVVQQAGSTFEEVWYGHADAGPAELEAIGLAVDQAASLAIRQEVGR